MIKRTSSCRMEEDAGVTFVFAPISVRVLVGAFLILFIGLLIATLYCFTERFSKPNAKHSPHDFIGIC